MKKFKFLSIVLALLVATALTLTACNNPEQATTSVNWQDGDEQYYDVSLYTYGKPGNVTAYGDFNFIHDYQVFSDESKFDQIKPDAVSGQYHTLVTVDGANATYSTELTVEETFNSDNAYFATVEAFYNANSAELDGSQKTDDAIKLKSVVKTSVTFVNTASQTPVSSRKETSGFYVGKANCNVDKSVVTCTYGEKSAVVTTNGASKTVDIAAGTLDALQIPLLVLGLDKSQSTGQKYVAPSFTFFDIATAKVATATLAVFCNEKAVLSGLDADFPYSVVTTATVRVAQSGYAYIFMCNPNSARATGKSTGPEKTYDIVHFQSGYYSFEVDSSYYTQEHKEQLQYKAPSGN